MTARRARAAQAVSSDDLADIAARIRACRICCTTAPPLPHEPRPVLRVSKTARLLVAGQAPGVRVHKTGLSFNDPSGDRLRDWMGISRELFYDEARVAIVPMGFCFPGHDKAKGDLPPRKECRAAWHDLLFETLPQIETVLAIGRHAQDYHFARAGIALPRGASLAEIVGARQDRKCAPRIIDLPHPSWRNNAWLKKNPWFEEEILPMLRREVQRALR